MHSNNHQHFYDQLKQATQNTKWLTPSFFNIILTFEGRISTAGGVKFVSLSETAEMLGLPRSWGDNPGKHCANNDGARMMIDP